MADFLQTLTVVLTLGSLYALIALGYTMVYGILRLINFAHSDVVVLGAWSSLTISAFLLPRLGVSLDAPPWWAGAMVLVAAMLVCGIAGFLIERLAYRPLRKAPRLNTLITAMGVSLLLQNAGQLQWTIIPDTTTVASGKITARGTDPKTLLLDQPITVKPASHYVLELHPPITSGAPTPTVRRVVTAEPGDYPAGKPIAVADAVGKSTTRDATFTLATVSTALKLPFGTQPALTPTLLPTVTQKPGNVLFQKDFTSTLRLPDGTDRKITKPWQIQLVDVVIVACAFALMGAMEVLIFHTRLGTAMRAVSFNTDYAALMGIPIDRVISFTFVLGAILAAAAGFLYGQKYGQLNQAAHYTWVLLGLKAFVAAVVGGIGNVRGAVVGGFLIAFIEQFGGLYASYIFPTASAYTVVAVFVLLILVLMIKPSGLFGSTVQEKV